MKKIILVIVFLFANTFVQAQFGGILDKAKKKVEEKTTKKAEKKAEDTIDGKTGDNNTSEEKPSDVSGDNSSSNGSSTGVKAYSKFDFIPGEKIVVIEDFMQDAVGDFPDKWNTNSSGEVVTIDKNPAHWLFFKQPGSFMPEFIDTLPDNFTFEYDMYCIHGNKTGGWGTFHTVISELKNRDKPHEWNFTDNHYY
ncbi:MAG: hypothetical protein ACHQNT_13390, partial [Bacteroidia bacterium]